MTRDIVVIVGSVRKNSIDRRVAKALIKRAPKEFACEFIRIDDLPVFNQDHDQEPTRTNGAYERAERLRRHSRSTQFSQPMRPAMMGDAR